MASKEMTVFEPKPYQLTEAQVTIVANTDIAGDKRGKIDDCWAAIFMGRSIGIDDITALQQIHVINSKPGLSASLATALVRRRGHKIEGEMSAKSATARGERADNGATMSVTFTIEDAQKAGLAGKQVWKQYAQSMLWARAVTQLCRSLFSDCFIGGVYTPEELGADFAPDDDVIDGTAEVPAPPAPPEPLADDEPEAEAEAEEADWHAADAPHDLDSFKAWARGSGLSNEQINEKATELFGRTVDPAAMIPEEFVRLYEHLTREPAAA